MTHRIRLHRVSDRFWQNSDRTWRLQELSAETFFLRQVIGGRMVRSSGLWVGDGPMIVRAPSGELALVSVERVAGQERITLGAPRAVEVVSPEARGIRVHYSPRSADFASADGRLAGHVNWETGRVELAGPPGGATGLVGPERVVLRFAGQLARTYRTSSRPDGVFEIHGLQL